VHSYAGLKSVAVVVVFLVSSTWQIAEQAEFFSFGTNDLTQMTFGYSRDDVGKFIPVYLAQGILQHDPFEVTVATLPATLACRI
jgi:phosphoenolpyruvate synthase/pyruvate phosphate dikinase